MSHLETFIRQEFVCTNWACVHSATWFESPRVCFLFAHRKTPVVTVWEAWKKSIFFSYLVQNLIIWRVLEKDCERTPPSWPSLKDRRIQVALSSVFFFCFSWETFLRQQDIRCPTRQTKNSVSPLSFLSICFRWGSLFSCMIGIITLTRQRTGTDVLPNW